jgi:cell division protein ZapA
LARNGENREINRQRERGEIVADQSVKITVEIFGEKHVVRGDGSASYILGLAHDVDNKMRLIAQRLPRLSVQQIAILTALNLADELAKLKEEQETLMQLLGEKTE